MGDPREPAGAPPEARAAAAETEEAGETAARSRPALGEEEVRAVAEWMTAFAKALRSARVYAENNEMYQKFVDRAFEGLTSLLERYDELDLGIRDDRLLFGGEVVLHDPDRQDGLPFVLYRNAFRRLTLVRGISRDELVALMGAINTDYGAFDLTSEDLVSTLWRLRLPHVRYVTIDALGLDRPAEDDLDDEEADRIQAQIEEIVAAVYRNGAPDDDIVKGVTIGVDDLAALADLRDEAEEDLDRLEQATERAIADIPPGHLEAVRAFLERDDRDALTKRMLDILVRILFREESSAASGATIDLLQQLYDALLLGQRYADARELVERLRETSEQSSDMREMHISQHILRLFASDARLLPVLDAFNDGYRSVQLSELIAFLRALGPEAVPVLLAGLDNLDSAAHRKIICDLIVELGVPDISVLEERSQSAKWFVVRDILELARHHPLERISRLVREALRHEHPKVRAQAVRVLKDYGPGLADELVGDRLRDEDVEVRMVAARVAASRKSKSLLPVFEAIIKDEDLSEREPRELKLVLGAYATVGQGAAVRGLAGLLHPSFFARLKNVDLQLAAASALGLIPSDNARGYLRKGARSLNPRLREACRRALAHTRRSGESEQGAGSPAPRGPDIGDDRDLPPADPSELVVTPGAALTSEESPRRSPLASSDLHPAMRSGPAVPRVDPVPMAAERMPENLPPSPAAEARPHGPASSSLSEGSEPIDALDAFVAAYQAARADDPQPGAPASGEAVMMPEVLEYLGRDAPEGASLEDGARVEADTSPERASEPPAPASLVDAPIELEPDPEGGWSEPPTPADASPASWGAEAWDEQARIDAAFESMSGPRAVSTQTDEPGAAFSDEPGAAFSDEPGAAFSTPLAPPGAQPLDLSDFAGLTPEPRSSVSSESKVREEESFAAHLAADLFLDEPDGEGSP